MHSPELGEGINGLASARFSLPTPAGDDIEIVSASQTFVSSMQQSNSMNGGPPAELEIKDETQSSPMFRRIMDPVSAGIESQSLPPLPQIEVPSSQSTNRLRYRPSPVPAQSSRLHRNFAFTTSNGAKRKGRDIYDFPSTDDDVEENETPRPRIGRGKKVNSAKPTKAVPESPSVQLEHEHLTSSQKKTGNGSARKARMRRPAAQLAEEDHVEKGTAEREETEAIATAAAAAAKEQERQQKEAAEARQRALQAAEERERRQKAEQARLAKEEEERLAKEEAEKVRLAKEEAEKQRLAKQKDEEAKRKAQEEEKDRLAAEAAAEEEPLVKEKAEQERLDQEKERLAKEKAEKEHLANEKPAAEPVAERRAEDGRSTIENEERERLEKEKQEAAEESGTDAIKKLQNELRKKKAAGKKEKTPKAKDRKANELEEQKAKELEEQKAKKTKELEEQKAKKTKEREEQKAKKTQEREEQKAKRTKELEEQKAKKTKGLEEQKTKETVQKAKDHEQQKAKGKHVKDEVTPTATKSEAMTVKPEVTATKKRARKDSLPTGDGKISPDAKVSNKKVRTHSPVAVRQSQSSSTPSAERDMGPPPVPNSAMKRSNLKKELSSQEPLSASKKRNSVSFAENMPSSQGFPGSSAPTMSSTPTPIARPLKRTPIVCPLPAATPMSSINPSLRTVTPILPPGSVRPSEKKEVVTARKPPTHKPESSSESESESGSGSESENEAVPRALLSAKVAAPTKPKVSRKLLVVESNLKASTKKANTPTAGSAPVPTNNNGSDVEMQDAPPPSTAPVSLKATRPKTPSATARVSHAAPVAKSAPHVVSSDSESEDDDEMKPPPSAQISKSEPPQSSQASKLVGAKKPVAATVADDSDSGSDTGSESDDHDDEPTSTNKAASALNSLLGKAKSTAQSLVKSKAISPAMTKKLSSLGDLESRVKFDVREIHPSQQVTQQASQSTPSSQSTAKNVNSVTKRVIEPESESESGSESESASDSDSDADSKSKAAIPDHKKAGSNKKKPAGAMGFGRIFSGV
ncbi:hypothetical protein BZA05DRAFT_383451 [Tricharina praecox]|uniref:uncharacterized protein n=1 Tax=Tricharina praecox TaxID=43433 RepID=UPI00221F8879|nr:uncharacterized protein BZA05DRAFT_383451 [Tricharina praecox]KAI5859132.1 hypothetical protein BZA05DRAFT_383451 [Tricharina praecox]